MSFEIIRTTPKSVTESVRVQISSPYFGGEDWRVDIDLPTHRDKPLVAVGVDPQQALELGESFVDRLIEGTDWRRA